MCCLRFCLHLLLRRPERIPFKEFGWGFSLWNFTGSFGIIGHKRPGAHFEMLHGYAVDRALFDLILANRV